MIVKRMANDDSVVRRVVFRGPLVRSILIDPYLLPHEAESLIALFKKLAPLASVKQSEFNASPGG